MVVLLFVVTINAQDKTDERFSLGLYFEPQHYLSTNTDALIHWKKADGFNVGVGIDYELNIPIYLRFNTYYFPKLHNILYFDFDGGVGYNWRSNNDKHRIYAGVLIGAIYREGWGHGKTGIELGYNFYFNNMYTGFKLDSQYKHDDKIWRNNESGHNVESIGIKLGIILK